MILLSAPTNNRFLKITYGVALKNIAKECGLSYKFVSDCSGTDSSLNKSIIFQIETRESQINLENLKQRYPNSYIFRICMDSPYCDKFDKNTFKYVDHHLNFISEYVKIGEQFVKSNITFGTLSESLLKYFTHNTTILNKEYHSICMCTMSTSQRFVFFRTLLEQRFKILVDLKIKNLNQTRELYEKSWCVLGHTMSPHQNMYQRSMKAWRDWIGPCTNTIIIYDNHPTILEYFEDIIPTYDYNNPFSFLDCLYNYIVNPVVYIRTLSKQQEWIKNNTIEKQLLPLVKEII